MPIAHHAHARRLRLAFCLAPLLLAGCVAGQSSEDTRASGELAAFRSDGELRDFLRRAAPEALILPVPAPMAAPPVAESEPLQEMGDVSVGDQLNDLPALRDGITNTQEASVDEGGIVKLRGDTLVILRRGRLFTLSIADGGLRSVDSIDAFPPGAEPGDYYDEMLVLGDRVIVIGYSYEHDGTEISRFRLDRAGRLTFEDAYHLRSDDYYSSRNYASRLIGNRLIFYTPLSLEWDADPLEALPGLRKWKRGDREGAPFRRIARAHRIFIAPTLRDDAEAEIDTLHSVTDCDLAAPVLDCSATGILGPASDTFYVSAGAVYLWMGERWPYGREPAAHLYRLPFGREAPSAIGIQGGPVDQFSFREDAGEGVLNLLLREETHGDSMGGPEVSGGSVSLLRLPIAAFGDGSQQAPRQFYRALPGPAARSWSFRNRFVGGHVLYGAGSLSEGDAGSNLFVAPVRGGEVASLALGHSVDRIEALGRDALVVGEGAGESLRFSAIELDRPAPALGDVFTLPAASEGETRSHAFFFRPTAPDGSSGLLGLPIARDAPSAYERFFGSAAAMLFLRRDARRFAPAGEIAARLDGVADDACRASCDDWYGNARPIFIGERVFALLGYELVEGRLTDGRIREIARVDFTPRRRDASQER